MTLVVYNPREQGDARFDALYEKFPGMHLTFTSGFSGWSWSAKWNKQYVGADCFLADFEAIDDCLKVLGGDPQWKTDPFAHKRAKTRDELVDYLDKWSKKHG